MSGPLYAIRKSRDGQFYFYLRAANMEIIATSEMYTTKAAAERGVEAVRKNAPTPTVLDMTEDN